MNERYYQTINIYQYNKVRYYIWILIFSLIITEIIPFHTFINNDFFPFSMTIPVASFAYLLFVFLLVASHSLFSLSIFFVVIYVSDNLFVLYFKNIFSQ